MQTICFLLSILAISTAYTDINDKYYDTLVADKEKQRALLKCFVDKGPCDDFAAHIKSHMPEILSDGCKECDTQQKHYAHILISRMWKDFPELTEDYEAKYDSKRDLLKKLDSTINVY